MRRPPKKTILLQLPTRMYKILRRWMIEYDCEDTFLPCFLSWLMQNHRRNSSVTLAFKPPETMFTTKTFRMKLDTLVLHKLERLSIEMEQPRHIVLFIALCEYLELKDIFSYDEYVFSREQYGLKKLKMGVASDE